MAKNLIWSLIVFIVMYSCRQNREYLTDEEKKWNPYKKGQTIVFSSDTGIQDSVFIEDILYQFPDGLGVAYYYEILSVVARHSHPKYNRSQSTYWLSVFADTPERDSRIIFGLSAKNANFFSGDFSLKNVEMLPETYLSVPYGSFSDVIIIENERDYSHIESAVEVIYWSKSKGYIRYDKYDGTSWELIDIVEKYSPAQASRLRRQ